MNSNHLPRPSLLCLALGLAFSAQAQTPPRQLDTIVVTGQRASLQSALDKQREAQGVLSVVHADGIGQLPDSNAAEALARLPGVTVERDQGEGRFVRVRGLGSDYNNVTINGATVPASEAGRRAPGLDVVPAGLIRSLEVNKTLTPDVDANSLGGSVSVNTLTAFDVKGRLLVLDAGLNHDSNLGKARPRASLTFADRFADGQLGLAVSLSSDQRRFASDNVETGGAWEGGKLASFELRRYSILRSRVGAAVSLDWRPAAGQALYLRGFSSRFTDEETRQSVKVALNAAQAPGELGGGTASRGLKDRREVAKTSSLTLGGKLTVDAWEGSAEAGVGRAEEDTPNSLASSAFDAKFSGLGFLDSQRPVLQAPATLRDAALYKLNNFKIEDSEARDRVEHVKLDVKRALELGGGDSLEVKAGAKATRRHKDNLQEAYKLKGKTIGTPTFAAIAGGEPVDYPWGSFGLVADADKARALWKGVDLAGSRDVADSVTGDFDMKENLDAAYAQATWERGGLQLLGGLRMERITFKARGMALVDDAAQPISVDTRSTHWLPALLLRQNLGNQLLLRAALTNSLVRPSFEQLSPGKIVDGDEAELGNPNLKPLRSRNLDFGLEQGLGRDGTLSAFVFTKRIKDFVFQTDLAGSPGLDRLLAGQHLRQRRQRQAARRRAGLCAGAAQPAGTVQRLDRRRQRDLRAFQGARGRLRRRRVEEPRHQPAQPVGPQLQPQPGVGGPGRQHPAGDEPAIVLPDRGRQRLRPGQGLARGRPEAAGFLAQVRGQPTAGAQLRGCQPDQPGLLRLPGHAGAERAVRALWPHVQGRREVEPVLMQRLLLGLALLACVGGAQADRFVLGKAALELHDDAGGLLARHAVRAKHMDQRSDDGALAVLQDTDSGQIQLWRARQGQLARAAAWPAPALDVAQLCLYRDPQGLLQLFLLGKEGLSEQWLIDGERALPVQRLATPLEPSACRARDAEATLYVAEPDVGLWALSANAERAGRRLLLADAASNGKALNARLEAWLADHPAAPAAARPPVVLPSGQTQPVREAGDAADDPAIWVHPRRGAQSLILATDKKRGLAVYGLDGRERQFLAVGRINNVDLRQGLAYAGRRLDLAVATQRDEAGLVLFGISPAGRVTELARLKTSLADIYGVCVGRNADGGLDVFPNDKDGRVLQLRLSLAGKTWRAEPVSEFRLASQPEGCVVDEAQQALFVGEEKRGIWRQDLATANSAPQLVIPVGPGLTADVEGMAIHPGRGWLVVSSQGSDSYAVYDTRPPFAQRGSFAIGTNVALGIDGVSETDGLDLSAANLGGPYADGVLVVQDGHKRLPLGPQNFKLVPWRDVEKAILMRP